MQKLLDCPASVVGTSTAIDATEYTCQRKSFFAKGRFWVFYSDGTNMVYYTSVDGITWAVGGSSPIRACTAGFHFSIWFDGTYVHYAHVLYSVIHYRRGTPNTDGTITWSAAEQNVSTTYNFARYPFVSIDTNGYAWIGYQDYTGTLYYPYVVKSGNNDGTWGVSTITQLSVIAADWRVVIIPLTAGKILAIYLYAGDRVRAQRWDGSSWGAEVLNVISPGFAYLHSAVAQSDDVHISFPRTTSYDILYIKYVYSTNSFTAEVTLQAMAGSVVSDASISRNQNTNDLYVFWISYPTANHIYYRKYTALTSTWEVRVDWINESVDTLTGASRLTSFYNAYGNYIGIVYLTKAGSPFNVKFDFLTTEAPITRRGMKAIHVGMAGMCTMCE